MKQTLAILFALAMVFSLFACQTRPVPEPYIKNETTSDHDVSTEGKTASDNANTERYEPPVSFRFSEEQVAQLRQWYEETEENETGINGFHVTRKDASALLGWLDSLPTPSVQGFSSNSLLYFPESQELMFTFLSPDAPEANWYRLEYVLGDGKLQNVQAWIAGKSTDETLPKDVPVASGSVKLLLRQDLSDAESSAKNHYVELWIEADGQVIKVVYRNNAENVPSISAEQILSPIGMSLPNQ